MYGYPGSLRQVAVLFCRKDSVYKRLPGVDAFDIDRDALNYPGFAPVIAHPPCRSWGRLRHFAKPRPGEQELALWSVEQVRQFGGVLEHPAGSSLWSAASLPRPGERDSFGGWTLAAPQYWWGHKAEKSTWFYVVGIEPSRIPSLPFVLGEPSFVVSTSKRSGSLPHISKSEREQTPPALAEWLLDLARSTSLFNLHSLSLENQPTISTPHAQPREEPRERASVPVGAWRLGAPCCPGAIAEPEGPAGRPGRGYGERTPVCLTAGLAFDLAAQAALPGQHSEKWAVVGNTAHKCQK